VPDLAGHGEFGALKGVHPDDSGQQRRPYHLTPVGGCSFQQSGERADDSIEPRQQVGDGHSDPLRVALRRSGQRHQPGFALSDLVVSGAAAFRSVMTEPRDGQGHQPRIELCEPLRGEAEPAERAGPKILDQHVRPGQQVRQHLVIPVGFQVEGDGFLVPVAAEEVGRFSRGGVRLDERRTPRTAVVAAPGGLDLDHPGPQVAQDHAGMRAGQRAGQVDDQQPAQRSARSRVGFVDGHHQATTPAAR
jgi:hypothetical protein